VRFKYMTIADETLVPKREIIDLASHQDDRKLPAAPTAVRLTPHFRDTP
jgi:hypothetical protein